ncbi:MAG: AbrB/MazE/SpoVT family DNA-binding domain-containing protein [Hydrogenophilales bacterium]|nr:AbrB/MazE/SpoVT family DNA-binding domain-containing protein [Hydrogenophilales bacterium]
MQVHISKWGNSLAFRIPAEYARQLGVKDGDNVEAKLTPDGGLSIRPSKWDRKLFADELAVNLAAMPMGASVMDEVRRGGRY